MEKGSNTLLDRRRNYNYQFLIQSHFSILDPIHVISKERQACGVTLFAPNSSLITSNPNIQISVLGLIKP